MLTKLGSAPNTPLSISHERFAELLQQLSAPVDHIPFRRNGVEHRLRRAKFDYNDSREGAFTHPRFPEVR
jgi:hypothetical protein